MNPGDKVGPYEILEPLGAGGMGEVYLGRDTRLGREVAIKVLPEEFAGDPDRLARFEQEARAAAALNHPHIAAVYDVGHEDGTHFMVQELLEGRSLADALAAGRMPLKAGLELATEIAEALGAAHAAGIVHRDLKPANVFVTAEGYAKVLDFGLAKLTEVARASSSASASMSPTVLGTMAGQIMGTAGYMAPEQVEGGDVDHRADLFAFGCLLYELATGKRAFGGKNLVETLHRVSNTDPDGLAGLDASLPVDLQRILDKAMAKDRAARYQTAGDLAVDLKALTDAIASGEAISIARSQGDAARSGWSPMVGGGVAVAALVIGVVVGALLGPTDPAPAQLTHFEFQMLTDNVFTNGNSRPLSISRDGEWVAFGDEGQVRLRQTSTVGITDLRGASAPRTPVFSPDAEWVAYGTGAMIAKVPRAGGAPIELAPMTVLRGLSWTDDGHLLAATDEGILQVPADGEQAELIVTAQESEALQGPSLLPGGEWVVFSSLDLAASSNWSNAQIVAQSRVTGERRLLISGGVEARYVESGHLVYARDGVIFGVPFDPAAPEVLGGAVPLIEGVAMASAGGAYYDLSPRGHLVYFLGAGESGWPLRPAWVDRAGNVEVLDFDPANLDAPALAPDGRRLAVQIGGEIGTTIWIYELDRRLSQRLTPDGLAAGVPSWSPDGEWVYFRDGADGTVKRIRADFTGVIEPVGDGSLQGIPADVSADGRLLAVSLPGTNSIGVVELPAGAMTTVIEREAVTVAPRFSPDGRLLAYMSQETGDMKAFVRELDSGRRHVVSPPDGRFPIWSPDGGTLYYRTRYEELFAVAVTYEPEVSFGPPQPLFTVEMAGQPRNDMVIAPDGERFLVLSRGGAGGGTGADVRGRIQVILNWGQVLRGRVPLD